MHMCVHTSGCIPYGLVNGIKTQKYQQEAEAKPSHRQGNANGDSHGTQALRGSRIMLKP